MRRCLGILAHPLVGMTLIGIALFVLGSVMSRATVAEDDIPPGVLREAESINELVRRHQATPASGNPKRAPLEGGVIAEGQVGPRHRLRAR
jgi:hypothetical protein